MPNEDIEASDMPDNLPVLWLPGGADWEVIMSRDFGLSLPALLLYAQATTIQERVFARLITNLRRNSCLLYHVKDTKFPLYPSEPTIQGFLAAAQKEWACNTALASIPIKDQTTYVERDPELIVPLQDLADIIAWEASEAFRASYYPGIPEVDALTPDHVTEIMAGMQREATRERRSKQEVLYAELPRKRQVALAERRRWWFGHFGITPQSWKSGNFSLWNVSADRDIPDMGKSS
ncbi:hypothetical protein LCGC14_1573430 [marine sediment metagenome]|uniref:Uncharacterized protein n=2 Tax=marine sediment metagenome TaxID=412755 RepID=A0A0F9LJF6_9ZZZZ